MIPVDIDSIKTGPDPLDESITYRVILRKIEVTDRVDKNNLNYMRLDTEIIQPLEFQGRRVGDPYVAVPVSSDTLRQKLGRDPSQNERRMYGGEKFATIVRCFKIPYTPEGIDEQRGVGREGNVTIKNEEYPQGSGTIRSKINNYLPAA